MKRRRLNIAVAKPLVVPGNVRENIRRMRPLVAEAARRGADLVLFSECGINGYDLAGVSVKAAIGLNDPALNAVAALARRHRVAVVAGFDERDGNTLYNSAMAFLPNGRRIHQRKHRIAPGELRHAVITPGLRRRTIFRYRGFKLAMLICADSGIKGIFSELARAGCDAVLCLTAGLGDAKKGFRLHDLKNPRRRTAYLKAAESVCFVGAGGLRALDLNMGLAAANQAGYDGRLGYFHPGHCSVINRNGAVTALIPGQFCFEHLRPQVAVGFVEK